MHENRTQFYPKTAATDGLPGSVQREYKRCGKPNCRCARGALHGPYARRAYRVGGRTHRVYVPLAAEAEVRALCVRYQHLHLSGRAFTRLLRDIGRRTDELIAELRTKQRAAVADPVREIVDGEGLQ